MAGGYVMLISRRRGSSISWIVEALRERAKAPTDIEAIAAKELERLRAQRDHWYDLVSPADRTMFPFKREP